MSSREKSKRNAYMLKKSHKKGYDWWWHSLVAEHANTGVLEPFFIEYYIVNPGLGGKKPLFGQIPNKSQKPAYAMIKAGKWGEGKSQIHNFWGCDEFEASKKKMDVRISNNFATETALKGSVFLNKKEAKENPWYMSDYGEMSWDLTADKEISYSVGYGASAPFRKGKLFTMFWHIQGMKTKYSGTITYNGQLYYVKPETSFGYQDKNWGTDYTNPWIWLSCNRFKDSNNTLLEKTSLDIGGGNPRLKGISFGEKILVGFVYEGKLYEFNFSYLFFQKQQWDCRVDKENVYWDVDVSNRTHRLQVSFSCPKKSMLLVNYENPEGKKEHKELWNGGYAFGTLKLVQKRGSQIICQLKGDMGGCEYGRIV